MFGGKPVFYNKKWGCPVYTFSRSLHPISWICKGLSKGLFNTINACEVRWWEYLRGRPLDLHDKTHHTIVATSIHSDWRQYRYHNPPRYRLKTISNYPKRIKIKQWELSNCCFDIVILDIIIYNVCIVCIYIYIIYILVCVHPRLRVLKVPATKR